MAENYAALPYRLGNTTIRAPTPFRAALFKALSHREGFWLPNLIASGYGSKSEPSVVKKFWDRNLPFPTHRPVFRSANTPASARAVGAS